MISLDTAPCQEEVRCVRFSGSRFSSHVLVFRMGVVQQLRNELAEPDLYDRVAKALAGTIPYDADGQEWMRSLGDSIRRSAVDLAPPFEQGVSKKDLHRHEAIDIAVRLHPSGTHFHLDVTCGTNEEVSLLLSAPILVLFCDAIG